MRYIVLMILLLSSSLSIAQKINASWQIHAANLYHYNVDGKVESQEEITSNLSETTFHNVPIAWDFGPEVSSEKERASDIEIPKGLMMQTIGSTSFFAYSIEDDRIILYYLLPGQGYLPGQSFAFRFENEWLIIDYPMSATTSSSGSISVLTCKYSRIP